MVGVARLALLLSVAASIHPLACALPSHGDLVEMHRRSGSWVLLRRQLSERSLARRDCSQSVRRSRTGLRGGHGGDATPETVIEPSSAAKTWGDVDSNALDIAPT